MLGWKHANKTYGFEQLDCLGAMVPFGKLTSLPWKNQHFLIGKSTIMAIFNSYVSLAEGTWFLSFTLW